MGKLNKNLKNYIIVSTIVVRIYKNQMKNIFWFLSFFLFPVIGQTVIDGFGQSVIKEYCPFRDLYGLSPMCVNSSNGINDVGPIPLPVLVGVGWDPVLGQIRLPFLEMSYNNKNIFVSNNDIQYLIPDQINFTVKNISFNYERHVDTFENIYDYVNYLNLNRTNITSGLLSLPIEAGEYLVSYFGQGDNNIYLVTEIHHAYQLELLDVNNLQIIPSVQDAINSLPLEYNDTIYSEFINYWGTDIVISGFAGGLAQQTSMVRICYGGLNLDDTVELSLLKGLYAAQYQNVNFQSGFTQYSSASIINMYGGNPIYVQPANWSQRMESFEDYPVLTEVITVPITNFIQNLTIKANLLKAIELYLNNETHSRNNLIQNWIDSINGPRNINWVPAYLAPPTTNYAGQLVAFGGYEKIYSLGKNQNTGGLIYCARDNNGSIYTVDNASGDIQIRQGESVRQGCSYTQWYDPPAQGESYGITFRNYCCQGCIPSLSGELVYYVGGHSYPEPGTGLLSCTCPTI